MKNPFKNIRIIDIERLITLAFNSAAKAVKRGKYKGNILEKARQKEGIRVKIAGNIVYNELKSSAKSFPNINKIPEIYCKILDAIIGIDNFKKSIGSITRTANNIRQLQMKMFKRLSTSRNTYQCRDIRKEFYGRINSFLKSIKKEIKITNDMLIFKDLPDFKDIPTVIIAGLPNVGKTSLLKAITGSEPEIKPYPFTTKGLMLGYYKNIQVIDTPGLLDRPLEKRNKMEMFSIVVLENLSNVIIYVFDISETCGYSLERQEILYKDIKRFFNKPIIVTANKIDIIGGKTLEELSVKNVIPISCETGHNINLLKETIEKLIK